MPVRTFNGSSARIDFSIGGCNLTGAYTFAALQRRAELGTYDNLFRHRPKAGADLGGFGLNPSNKAEANSGAAVSESTATIPALDWVLIVISKAAGSVKPDFHIYDFTTAEWSHASGTIALGNLATQAEGSIRLGAYETEDFFKGDVAACAEWNGTALTQAEAEALKTATSLKAGWLAKSPSGLWTFEQSSVAEEVKDLTGNGANQTAISGTSVTAEEPPIPYKLAATPPVPGSLNLLGVGR